MKNFHHKVGKQPKELWEAMEQPQGRRAWGMGPISACRDKNKVTFATFMENKQEIKDLLLPFRPLSLTLTKSFCIQVVRIVKVGKNLQDHQAQPWTQHPHTHQTLSQSIASAQFLNTSWDSDSITSPCSNVWPPFLWRDFSWFPAKMHSFSFRNYLSASKWSKLEFCAVPRLHSGCTMINIQREQNSLDLIIEIRMKHLMTFQNNNFRKHSQ